jgi:hypothetical protein
MICNIIFQSKDSRDSKSMIHAEPSFGGSPMIRRGLCDDHLGTVATHPRADATELLDELEEAFD